MVSMIVILYTYMYSISIILTIAYIDLYIHYMYIHDMYIHLCIGIYMHMYKYIERASTN